MIGAGCTTMQSKPPRAKPITEMQSCPELLEVATGDPGEALSVAVGNMMIHAKCEGWRQTLIKWINGAIH